MQGFTQTWAGECSAWECDDLGHLNMRHYMTKMQQARQMMVIRLGLDEAYKAKAHSSVRLRKFHIKYLGEARPGALLRIESAVLELGETDIQFCHIMYHHNGRVACTVIEWADHIYLRSSNPFPWPSRVRARVSDFLVKEQPAPSKPRGLKYDEMFLVPSAQELQSWGAKRVGCGVFQPHEEGRHGGVMPQALMGRVTETVGHYPQAWPEMLDETYRAGGGHAALLEAFVILGQSEAGRGYDFYSGIHSADQYTRRLVHNMVDVVSGENIFSMTGIGCLFNLKTRKLVKTSDETVKAIMAKAVPQFIG